VIVFETPVLLFGGCYSNLQATRSLLDWAAAHGFGPETMICTGDIVAYGADARATLRLMRDSGIRSIAGNCEVSLAASAGDCGCGFAADSLCSMLAAAWYGHAAREVEDEDRRFMAGLPETLVFRLGGKTFRVVHGNVERINAFVFPSASNLELSRQLELAGADAVIAGHCGVPFTRKVGEKIWHNPGAIGMPANDGTARMWFSVLDVRDREIFFTPHPHSYDFEAAAAAMRAKNLPEGYAEALETGIWPSLDILPAADRRWAGVKLESRQSSEVPPVQTLERLETLWVNTGTLCNLACQNCFMESTPANDALAYMPLADVRDLLRAAPESVEEIGFTGGEPFMNPDIIKMLEVTLAAGKSALVLTNAMRPMRRHERALQSLITAYSETLMVRVSLDHYEAGRHDALRGENSFAASLAGLRFLVGAGAKISVAARTPWGETEAMMRAGFARLFKAEEIPLDAQNPTSLVLFPEMDGLSPVEPVTAAAMAAVPAETPLMCATSRMAVLRKGASGIEITPCTLLPGRTLDGLDDAVTLDHPHCGRFCVYGGASCAGAQG
jgi:predicted phosphodiesterase/uncharacterized Fe-S cluster-containing radical SAM superfamily protein